MKDPQKHALYHAEQVLGDDTRVFTNLEQMEEFVAKVLRSNFWTRRSNVTKVVVKLGRKDSGKACCYKPGRKWRGEVINDFLITIPTSWAPTYAVLLHELAHVLTSRQWDHGSDYAQAYLDLVENFMGPISHKKLKQSFNLNAIDYTSKITEAKKQEATQKAQREASSYLAFLSTFTK